MYTESFLLHIYMDKIFSALVQDSAISSGWSQSPQRKIQRSRSPRAVSAAVILPPPLPEPTITHFCRSVASPLPRQAIGPSGHTSRRNTQIGWCERPLSPGPGVPRRLRHGCRMPHAARAWVPLVGSCRMAGSGL
jgi:hypothetical protein